jgi:hypothetical protein
MLMWKECKIIMLPTSEGVNALWWSGQSLYTKGPEDPSRGELNHLYITSDDKIEVGDWCIYTGRDLIFQIEAILDNHYVPVGFEILRLTPSKEKTCKIIATTHKSIINDGLRSDTKTLMKEIPESFKDIFVKGYNSGAAGNKVKVQYEGYGCDNGHYMKDAGWCVYPHCDKICSIPQLKSNSDNTIIVKLVKTRWTREEVVEKLIECCAEISCTDGKLLEKSPAELCDWIEENL